MTDQINPRKAAVVGHPIGHTMSPFIHKRLFQLAGIPLEYSVLDVPDLKEKMPELRHFDCFNVTIPHKTAIIPYLDKVEEKAAAFGSVNTVKAENGKLTGYTTDGAGCFAALQNHGADFSGKVLILGNGGAARAIAFEAAYQKNGFDLTLACREASLKKAEVLKEELLSRFENRGQVRVLSYSSLEQEQDCRYRLLINATSVGMYPHTEESPVSGQVVSRCETVFDAVYNPGETQLLKLGKQLGAKTVGGMEMLVYQAAAAHEIWFGSSFPKEEMERLIYDAQVEMERLFGRKK